MVVWETACPRKNPMPATTFLAPLPFYYLLSVTLISAPFPHLSPLFLSISTESPHSPLAVSLPPPPPLSLSLSLSLSAPSPKRFYIGTPLLHLLSLQLSLFCLSSLLVSVFLPPAPGQSPGLAPASTCPFPTRVPPPVRSASSLANVFRMARQSNALLMSLKHAENCILMKKNKKANCPVEAELPRGSGGPEFRGAELAEVCCWQEPECHLLPAAFQAAPTPTFSPPYALLLPTSPRLFPPL